MYLRLGGNNMGGLMLEKTYVIVPANVVAQTLKSLSFILAAFLILFGLDYDLRPFSYLYIILINVIMVIKCRRNMLMFLILFIIAYSNYSIIYANFIGHINSIFTEKITDTVSCRSLNVLLLFNCLLHIFMIKNIPVTPDNRVFINRNNKDWPVIIILLVILLMVFFLGFEQPEIEGGRGNPHPIYEYSIIFFILYFYYSGGNKWIVTLGLFFVLIYSAQNQIVGGRILALQFLLCAYIFIFMHKIQIKYMLILMIIAFFFLSVIGSARGAIMEGNTDIKNVVLYTLEKGGALDTAYAAYFASETFVYLRSIFPDGEILRLSVAFIKSIFVGASEDMVLPNISSDYINHYGGGVYPLYMYFYMGRVGMILAVLLLRGYFLVITHLNCNSHGLSRCLSVFVVCHTFRWYLYTPLGLFRAVLFLVVVYVSLEMVHRAKLGLYRKHRIAINEIVSN